MSTDDEVVSSRTDSLSKRRGMREGGTNTFLARVKSAAQTALPGLKQIAMEIGSERARQDRREKPPAEPKSKALARSLTLSLFPNPATKSAPRPLRIPFRSSYSGCLLTFLTAITPVFY